MLTAYGLVHHGAHRVSHVASPADPWYLTLAPYGVGLITFLAALATVVLTRHNEQRAWRRDNRLKAYGDLIESGHLQHFALLQAWDPSPGQQAPDALWTEINRHNAELHRRLRIVQWLGPKSVFQAADQFVAAHMDLGRMVAAADHVARQGAPPQPLRATEEQRTLEEASDTMNSAIIREM